MCWSGPASAAVAVGGLSSAYFLYRRGERLEFWLPTAYFVLMEGLQAVTYLVVDDCTHPMNPILTYLAIIHISFQVWFINMIGMEFIDPEIKKRIKGYVYFFCALGTLSCLIRLVPEYSVFGRCLLGTALCSHDRTCAYPGQWHIAWEVLLNGFNERWNYYLAVAFVLPALYGSWRWSLYHAIVGPFAAALTTTDVNERPAVWCLFSTMIIAMMINTRLRDKVQVHKWFTWGWLMKLPARWS